MNAEIQRQAAKCEKYRKKIAELQGLLDEAERKKNEAENAYIVSKVRSSGYTTDELLEAVLLLKSRQDSGVTGKADIPNKPDDGSLAEMNDLDLEETGQEDNALEG